MVQIGVIKNSLFLIGFLLFVGCLDKQPTNKTVNNNLVNNITTPQFNADSAYSYIEKQVAFGPRVPNTEAHVQCMQYLVTTLMSFGAKVELQEDVVKRYDGVKMNMKNIIASFNSTNHKRILLCAHWDSRFIADNDVENVNQPILGANDGGSGVGVLIEIARQLSLHPIDLGVDIILFDVEDQGPPSSQVNQNAHTWCLGSQYWATNPHVDNYFANYGILLDMVGAPHAKFTKEGVSREFASRIIEKVWSIASDIGFSDFFIPEKTPPIIDDHLYINTLIHIPTINIIEYDSNTHNRFNKHHHKHTDNMGNIDKKTLKAVGQTVLEAIYQE